MVQFGHNRNGEKGFPRIVYGLLCNADGCPVAIEVFAGNRADPNTLASQIAKIRDRFGVQRVVMVGDRGMIANRRIDEELRGVEGLDWITALRAEKIRKGSETAEFYQLTDATAGQRHALELLGVSITV